MMMIMIVIQFVRPGLKGASGHENDFLHDDDSNDYDFHECVDESYDYVINECDD